MYAGEQLNNSAKQLEATKQELQLAEERMNLGGISRADYLQVKSQYASEKLTLANSQRLLSNNRLELMQLMDLPVTDSFTISAPGAEAMLLHKVVPNADSLSEFAQSIKPEIKSAAVQIDHANLGVNIAKAGYLPTLSLNAGLSSGYSSLGFEKSYSWQLEHNFSPVIGLTLSIPIYQGYQTRGQVEKANISVKSATLTYENVKNQLRKSIESACVNTTSAIRSYEASVEQYNATKESYAVSTEKFKQGAINSTDFLIEKVNLITAESNMLQARYNLIFSYKTIDFYTGIPLSL